MGQPRRAHARTLSRRLLLQAGGALAGTLVLPTTSTRAHAADALPVREIAPGIFAHQGAYELATPGNLGGIANVGFVVGGDAVAVIDSGGSARAGARLRAAIRAVTERPIRYVVATHVHPDHLFGHAAFLGDDPTFIGHARLPAALAARGPFYLERLQEELGAAAAGTEIVAPTLLVEDTAEIDLGGRVLRIEAHPTAHTDNDLSVFDSASGTLWLSDLLFVERCPVIDGSLLGWLDVIERLAARRPARVVPGHGVLAARWPQAGEPQARYLADLRDQVRAVIAAGGTLEQAVAEVGREWAKEWLLFETYHPRNVTAAFTELEWE